MTVACRLAPGDLADEITDHPPEVQLGDDQRAAHDRARRNEHLVVRVVGLAEVVNQRAEAALSRAEMAFLKDRWVGLERFGDLLHARDAQRDAREELVSHRVRAGLGVTPQCLQRQSFA